MSGFSQYLGLVKFAHTIFAMPFALMSLVYAVSVDGAPLGWLLLVQVVACMVFARNVAMGFNRVVDRRIDAANPRTAQREIPSGRVSVGGAKAFVAVNAVLFIVVACTINLLTAILSPVALAVVMLYSYCKRFTSLSHLVLGLGLGIAPAGAYIAATGRLTLVPCVIALLVMTWCAGFDIIYALQDRDFDRAHSLHSIPSCFSVGVSLSISGALHVVSVAALWWFAALCPQSVWILVGCVLFTLLVVAEHLLVTPSRQRNIGIAFGTLNGLASITLAAFVITGLLITA